MGKPKYQPGQTFFFLGDKNTVFIYVVLGRIGKTLKWYYLLRIIKGKSKSSDCSYGSAKQITEELAVRANKFHNLTSTTEEGVRFYILPYTVDSIIRDSLLEAKEELEKYKMKINRETPQNKQRIALLEAEIKRRTE